LHLDQLVRAQVAKMEGKFSEKGFVAMLAGWVRVPALVLRKAGKFAVKSGTRFRHKPDELIPVRASLRKVWARVIRLVLSRLLLVSSGRNRALIERIFDSLRHNVSFIDMAPLCPSCIAIAMTDRNAFTITVNRTEAWRTRDKLKAFRVRAD
jgi:hypothetical protein